EEGPLVEDVMEERGMRQGLLIRRLRAEQGVGVALVTRMDREQCPQAAGHFREHEAGRPSKERTLDRRSPQRRGFLSLRNGTDPDLPWLPSLAGALGGGDKELAARRVCRAGQQAERIDDRQLLARFLRQVEAMHEDVLAGDVVPDNVDGV